MEIKTSAIIVDLEVTSVHNVVMLFQEISIFKLIKTWYNHCLQVLRVVLKRSSYQLLIFYWVYLMGNIAKLQKQRTTFIHKHVQTYICPP